MHVLALVTDAFGGHGGIARYNRDFLTALADADGVETITVLPRLAPQPPETLPRGLQQREAIFDRAAYSFAALREARRMPKDTVLFCGHLLMSPLAAGIARLMRAPMWLQVHGTDAWDPQSRPVRWGAERARLVTAVSRYTRQRMLAGWWGGDPASIRVLPNTVDAEFSPGPRAPALVERYGLANRKVLLTVSRLSGAEKYKGHDRVILALPRILGRHPEALYLIVGDGDDEPRLHALVGRMGLGKHVHFAGRIAGAELVDHYRAADVFVMPSTGEGFGIVFLEAAACGLHVIGGNADGSLDALREGAIGEAVDPMDVEAIAAAVCRAFDAPDRPDPRRVEVFSFANFKAHVAALAGEIGGGQHWQM
jgi:phosphatidylinositol alpha-1,6-mannosyltransferase